MSVGDAKKPCLLVFYTHHRPHLAHRDMEFFSKAQERGWICEEVLTQTFPVSSYDLKDVECAELNFSLLYGGYLTLLIADVPGRSWRGRGSRDGSWMAFDSLMI